MGWQLISAQGVCKTSIQQAPPKGTAACSVSANCDAHKSKAPRSGRGSARAGLPAKAMAHGLLLHPPYNAQC